jgi:hypothetical protein
MLSVLICTVRCQSALCVPFFFPFGIFRKISTDTPLQGFGILINGLFPVQKIIHVLYYKYLQVPQITTARGTVQADGSPDELKRSCEHAAFPDSKTDDSTFASQVRDLVLRKLSWQHLQSHWVNWQGTR